MASRFSRVQRWVACALWCGVVGAAQAAAGQPSGEEFLRMLPSERQALVKSWRAQSPARAGSSTAGFDGEPPKLLAFEAGTSVDASDSLNELIVHLKVTDSFSGLRYLFVRAASMLQPQETMIVSVPLDVGTHRYNGPAALHLTGFAQPGLWRITWVEAFDLNGNQMNVPESQLSLLGNTGFTVTGGRNDTASPVLVGGTILTPELSLSQRPRGSAQAGPFLSIQVQLQDPGDAPVSGIRSAEIALCTATQDSCVRASYGPETRYGLSNVERVITQQVFPGMQPGDYVIHSMQFDDYAGHFVSLWSKDFGGSTDFSTLFPSTTVKIKP